MVEVTMNGLQEMRKLIAEGDIDILRTLVKEMAEALMGAEVDALCGASHGERHPERVNRRNGYRERAWDTRSGTIDLALPKLREGSYFPDWLLTPRRAQRAGPDGGDRRCLPGRRQSTRRVDKLVRTLGIEGISRSSGQPSRGLTRRARRGVSQPASAGPLPVPLPRRFGDQGTRGRAHLQRGLRARRGRLRRRAPREPRPRAASPARTGPAGRPSCAASWRAALAACCW